MLCDCCKEEVHALDEEALCFDCGLVQRFATIIEDATNVDDRIAVDVACDLAEWVKDAILRRSADLTDVGHTKFFADVARGMVRVGRDRDN